MRILRKTIRGESCELYVTMHHERVLFGRGIPTVEVIEDIADISVLWASITRKRYLFSVVLCDKMDRILADGKLKDVSGFTLCLWLPRKRDGAYEKVNIFDVRTGEIQDEQWTFEIQDDALARRLMNEYIGE